jgi:hypothetical protein
MRTWGPPAQQTAAAAGYGWDSLKIGSISSTQHICAGGCPCACRDHLHSNSSTKTKLGGVLFKSPMHADCIVRKGLHPVKASLSADTHAKPHKTSSQSFHSILRQHSTRPALHCIACLLCPVVALPCLTGCEVGCDTARSWPEVLEGVLCIDTALNGVTLKGGGGGRQTQARHIVSAHTLCIGWMNFMSLHSLSHTHRPNKHRTLPYTEGTTCARAQMSSPCRDTRPAGSPARTNAPHPQFTLSCFPPCLL